MKYFLALCFFAVGLWEAGVGFAHEPTGASTPGVVQGYIFTMIAAILNVAGSGLMACAVYLGERIESPVGTLSFILAVWGLVITPIETGPFRTVIVVQVSMTLLSALLCCCLCVGTKPVELREVLIKK